MGDPFTSIISGFYFHSSKEYRKCYRKIKKIFHFLSALIFKIRPKVYFDLQCQRFDRDLLFITNLADAYKNCAGSIISNIVSSFRQIRVFAHQLSRSQIYYML